MGLYEVIKRIFIECISVALQGAQEFLQVNNKKNLALIINSINAIILSFRFDKNIKNVEDQNKESAISSFFCTKSKKLRYIRKTAIKDFCQYLQIEQKIVSQTVIAEMESKGLSKEKVEHFKTAAATGFKATDNSQEMMEFKVNLIKAMEKKIHDEVTSVITQRRVEAVKKIQDINLQELRTVFSEKSGFDIPSDQIEQGINSMLTVFFVVIDQKLQSIFLELESKVNMMIYMLIMLEVPKQVVGQATQVVGQATQVIQKFKDLEDSKENIQGQLEFAYLQMDTHLKQQVQQLSQLFITMTEQKEEEQE